MRQLLISLSVVALATMGNVGCSSCDVCHDVGGPCGFYSLAGRQLPPPMIEEGRMLPESPARIDPYPEPPPMPTGPAAPTIR